MFDYRFVEKKKTNQIKNSDMTRKNKILFIVSLGIRLLSSRIMTAVISHRRKKFDYIIITFVIRLFSTEGH